jgi:eukaryotic-like serine/threonine-protein kinase
MTPELQRRMHDLFESPNGFDSNEAVEKLRWASGNAGSPGARRGFYVDRDRPVAKPGFSRATEVPSRCQEKLVPKSPSGSGRERLVTCPCCQSRVELPDHGGSGEVLCPSCGADVRPRGDATGSWSPADVRRPPAGLKTGNRAVAADRGFTPKEAIAKGNQLPRTDENQSSLRRRLRTVALVHLFAYLVVLALRLTVLADNDLLFSILNTIPLAALGSIIYLLSGRRALSPAQLKSLELGMFAMLACALVFYQYRALLEYSLQGNTIWAQMVMRNSVLGAAVLILTYGFYVPKSWRRAALVGGPLALVPSATLLVLCLRHPEAVGWLRRGSGSVAQVGIDTILLQLFAVASFYGAHTIYRLRRQVDEIRQLGQYVLGPRIGVGGMAEVFLAEHQLLKRPCAVKLIRPDIDKTGTMMQRFEREVRLTATLSHPNTVEIYDYGRTQDGTYYYVMEYLRGLSLAELVEQHGPLLPERAVYLLRQVCLALREAHAAGLIHRDIKPANIFAARRGGMDDFAKLLDFGLVREVAGAQTPHLTGEGRIVGTPMFMSPQQALGNQDLDERNDIYSLGAVAYYLLTGRPPFDQRSGIGLIIAHSRDPVIRPSLISDGIPEDLELVVLRCLAKDPADRFQDAESLEGALAECECADRWDHRKAARWWLDLDSTPGSGAPLDAVPEALISGLRPNYAEKRKRVARKAQGPGVTLQL